VAINRSAFIGRLRVAQGKDLLRRGLKVQAKARVLLGGTGSSHPKRVRTGQLRSSVQVQLRKTNRHSVVRIGTGVKHGRFVHDGTGLYGPRRRKITPKRAKVLVFSSTKYGAKRGKFRGKVVVRSVKGMRPNKFLKDALLAAKD
jgi:Bacteriophage HK97-gp10, putative tail-component